MSSNKSYYVVEFRLPFMIADAETPKDAALAAGKICEKEYGFFPSAWYSRVFEYGDIDSGIGVVAEYFANPTGTHFREVEGNIERHEEIIQQQKDQG